MADYAEDEYQPILTDSIRENVVVPFDCYLLLKANGRIVRFLKSGSVFPADKIAKFKSFQVAQLHIKNEDHPLYREYLRQFFQTTEGAAVYQEIQEKQKGGTEVVGLPTDFSLEPVTAVAVAEAESGIVKLLKDNIKELDDELKFRAELSEQETLTIKNASDKINEEVTRVEEASIVSDESETIISNITQKIEEEIQKIAGVAMRHDSGKSVVVRGMIDGVKEEVRTLVSSQKKAREAESPDAVESAEREVSESTRKIKSNIWKIKRLVDPNQATVVADSMNEMVSGLEKALGAKIILSSEVSKENELQAAEAATTALNELGALKEQLATALAPDSELHAKVEEIVNKVNTVRELNSPKNKNGALIVHGSGATVEEKRADRDLGKLKDIIRRQKSLIGGLQDKLKTTEKSFTQLNDRWLTLQSQIKPDLGDKHTSDVDGFGQELNEVHEKYTEAKKHSEGLMRISGELSATVGRRLKVADAAEKGTESEPESGEASPSDSKELNSENNVLKVQLQNSRSLLDSNEKKISQLQTLINENMSYIQALEKENVELKKTITSDQAHIQRLEGDNSRLNEAASDVDRVITQYKADIHSRDEGIRGLKDEVVFLQRDLNVFKSHYKDAGIDEQMMKERPDKLPMQPEFVALIAQKEEKLAERLEELEMKNQEIKELKRDVAKLTGHVQGVGNLKKQMSAKYERLKVERETTMKAQDGLNRKIAIMTNLSEKERQTVSKLTTLTEELRRDRMEYMNKTTAALQAHKEAAGKEMSLANQVQAEQQKNKMLAGQNDLIKKKQNQVLIDLGTAQKQIKMLEGELRGLRKQLTNVQSGMDPAEARALEEKLETLRKENKALAAQYVVEQRKSDGLAKEIKALQFKMKKTA